MPCLTTLSQFKDYLGLTSDSEDPQLLSILDGVETAIENYCRRKFKSAAYTEYHSGEGINHKILYLDHRPLTVLTSVHVDDDGYFGQANAFPDADEWTVGTDFVPARTDQNEKNVSALIALRGAGNASGYWPEGDGNIKVVYTAGYTAIPEDVILAIHMLGSVIRQNAENGVVGALKSEMQGRYSYELLTGADAKGDASGQDIVQAKSILKRYREIIV